MLMVHTIFEARPGAAVLLLPDAQNLPYWQQQ
jgi:hypothetical protein